MGDVGEDTGEIVARDIPAPYVDERRRILLIDDSEIVLAIEGSLLMNAGFEVRAVSSLRAFLNTLLDWKPHIIITDLYMPEMSGADLCTWLRNQIATARTPIVICSSAPDAELEEVARSVGADGYLSKQQGLQELPAKLSALCDEILW
ncbi:MAG TPA: response regulator [Kofleriaceae bacterium]